MKKITRRQFLKGSLTAGAMLAAGGTGALWRPRKAYAFSQSPSLRKFIQPLRNPLTGGIPLAASDGTRTWGPIANPTAVATHYTIDIGQFTDQLHPSLANPTRLWGYGQNSNFKHLGGIIVAQRGTPIQITFQNKLTADGTPTGTPLSHIIPLDTTIPGANQAPNRTAVHLHGGLVPWISDGGPFDWWTPDALQSDNVSKGTHGASWLNNQVLNPGATKGQSEYYYPNNQSARLVWYHDHAWGITRINAYAGIASAYVITDDYEHTLSLAPYNIPDHVNPRTLYLVFQDKIFFTGTNDSNYPVAGARSGDLWYAHEYDTNRWGPLGPNPSGNPPDPSIIPEFFGDTILVNGSVYPYVEVEQRQYRLRMLNACNARFLRPKLVFAQSNTLSSTGSAEANTGKPGPTFIQIQSEGGYLPAPAMLNGPGQTRLLMAPAERGDFIVDFRNVPPGSVLILYSDAAGPYPTGDGLNDYAPTNFSTPSSKPGFGPNTRTLLQFRVKARVGPADPSIMLPTQFTPLDPFILSQTPGVPTPIPGSATVRGLTLNEDFDTHGRLIQYLGTDTKISTSTPTFGREYIDSATEIVQAGAEEVWEIANLTGDTHPIHFHLVNVQVLSRQSFDANNYNGIPTYTGDPIAPDINELGWKETVRMNPGQVTRVYMRFDLPTGLPFTTPTSPRAADMGLDTSKINHEYVWHCHILEHEEHDMMRPLVVQETV
jgi:spore coat protein A, manganese oxidase